MKDIEQQVIEDILRRQAKGISKYGTTVANNPLDLIKWLQHAYEECLDQAIYLKRAIAELDAIPDVDCTMTGTIAAFKEVMTKLPDPILAKQQLEARMEAIKRMPPPTLEEVRRQFEACREHGENWRQDYGDTVK